MKKLVLASLLVLPLISSCGGNNAKTYIVTWDLDNGSELITEEYKEGEIPSYKGDTPIKEGTGPLSEEEKKAGKDECTYTFKGWDKEFTPINSDVTYKAIYNVHSYVTRISFKMDTIGAGKKVGFNFTYAAGENDIFVNWGDNTYSNHNETTIEDLGIYHIEHEYLIPTIRKDFSILVYGSIASLSSLDTSNVPVALELSNTNTIIDEGSFGSNLAITSIFISKAIKKINQFAFNNCPNLTTVTFEEGSELETIGNNAFCYTALTSIAIPKRVKEIASGAFNNCPDLTTVTFEEDSELETIHDGVFSISAITSIVIPKHVKKISDYAFNECVNLSTITFEEGSELETIGNMVFCGVNLASITFPKELKAIGQRVFEGCHSLSSVTFEKGSKLETISDGAFYSTSITSIDIPKSVKTIKDYAFDASALEVVNLTEFTIENLSNIPNIQSTNAFRGADSLKFYVANDKMKAIFTDPSSSWHGYADKFTTDPVPPTI